jgi:hypothetical protein
MINGHDASILWQKPLADKSWNVTNMGDLTWDGSNDAAIGTLYQDNRTYFMDGSTGETLKSVTGNTPIDALDAIPDIVGDSSMELVVGGRNGGVVCLSGGYDSTLTSVPGTERLHGNMAYVFPNPCDDRMHVVVSLKQKSDIRIRVTGITGREMFALSKGITNAGTHAIEINRTDFKDQPGSGVYVISVETAEGIQHLKVVFR